MSETLKKPFFSQTGSFHRDFFGISKKLGFEMSFSLIIQKTRDHRNRLQGNPSALIPKAASLTFRDKRAHKQFIYNYLK